MCIFILLIFHCNWCLEASTIGVYQRLSNGILKNYNPNLRPVIKANTTTVVKLHFGIMQLLDVEEVSKTIKCITFIEMIWKDEFLTWDESEYENIAQFRYPHNLIWKPDIILTNTPDLNDGSVANAASTNVIISSDGTVTNAYTAVYRATCKTMDMINFPFDHHTCSLDFASWTYSGIEVDIVDDSASYVTPPSMKMIPNSEWDIDITRSEKIVEDNCCPNETYPTIRIIVTLKRKPLYFLINIIIPITITCFISFVGMFNPSTNTGERSEKTFLGITTLLAISLLMFSVSSQLPVTSNGIPLMGLFLGMYMLTIAIAIIASAVIMHIDAEGLKGQPLPKWVKKWLILRIGKWLHVNGRMDVKSFPEKKVVDSKQTALKYQEDKNNTLISQMERMFFKTETLMNMFIEEKRRKDFFHNATHEWSLLAEVLDRICLIFFLTFCVVFTVVLFTTDKA